ncbi:DUF1036 domain-containing protein [Falsiphaeobacter marinintestinus]|uniref:DUF1036 domain-containing protein n=1 Tax=Falsiphaeobacter marinintestinus TaxID=1492905 RepID=UPI001FE67971|nr:DUF1036 domain-containing protein [Phaeobacter marinintestinus]
MKVTASVMATLIGLPSMGMAGLEICNDTETRKTVAIGYKDDGNWVSEGWWNIQPDDCVTPIKGVLKSRYYYMLAKSKGWTFADDNIAFCTTPEAFTIIGDESCEDRGYDKGLFRQIDTGKTAEEFSVALAPYIRRDKVEDAKSPTKAPEPKAGTYGEPYTNAATFQHCDFDIEPGYCVFYADGFRLLVSDDGRSDPYAFPLLADIAPGTPMQISGDLAAIHDSTAELVLYDVDTRPWTDNDRMLDQLQGYWYAVTDSADQFNILGSERIGYYDGNYSGTDAISVQDWCDRFSGDGPYLSSRDQETGDIYCYQIWYVDALELQLMYLPRGNVLEYRKLD